MSKRDIDVSKFVPNAPEGKFVRYAEDDNKNLVFISNSRNSMAVRDMIVKVSKVHSIPNSIDKPDLLEVESQQLEF